MGLGRTDWGGNLTSPPVDLLSHLHSPNSDRVEKVIRYLHRPILVESYYGINYVTIFPAAAAIASDYIPPLPLPDATTEQTERPGFLAYA